jgi:hypothetical protein
MTPGSTVNVYGRFPTEIATDPQSIQDLDVFYRSALSRGCGTENSGRVVPEDMGSNKVGGKRKSRRGYRGGAASGPNSLDSIMTSIQDMGSSLGNRPYLSTTPPNAIQSTGASWFGSTEPVPFPGSPVEQAWSYKTEQALTGLDPQAFVTSLPPSPQFSSWGASGGRRSRRRVSRRRKTQRRRGTKSRRA